MQSPEDVSRRATALARSAEEYFETCRLLQAIKNAMNAHGGGYGTGSGYIRAEGLPKELQVWPC